MAHPEIHPETGKVLNPLTGNWVQQDYAKKQGILEQAKDHTQKHFRQQEGNDSDEIDELLGEIDDGDADGGFEIDEDEFIPDSGFPDPEEFDPEQGAEPSNDPFETPPTPQGFDEAAKGNKASGGNHKGIYTGKGGGQQQRQGQQQQQQKSEEPEKRYEHTDNGGIRVVYPNQED